MMYRVRLPEQYEINIELIEVSREDNTYKHIRSRHYVPNHGCIGKQIHYLIHVEKALGSYPIGIISGASAVWACKPRDDFFGINRDNRISMIDKIINNVVFRLEAHGSNLASQILSIWRKQILIDWKERYHSEVIGFETFVYGKERTGASYKADNWKLVGLTQGSAKRKPHGAYNKGEREGTEKKMIFVREV